MERSNASGLQHRIVVGEKQATLAPFDSSLPEVHQWAPESAHGLGLYLTKKIFPLMTEIYIVHWELVKQSLGIGIMAEEIGDAKPMVQPAPEEFEPVIFPMWLTAHRELKTSRRVRVVFDLLATELS